jgi:hypothetical protein
MSEVKQDIELQRELDKVDWGRYLSWGAVRVQVRNGKVSLIAVERTYPKEEPDG